MSGDGVEAERASVSGECALYARLLRNDFFTIFALFKY